MRDQPWFQYSKRTVFTAFESSFPAALQRQLLSGFLMKSLQQQISAPDPFVLSYSDIKRNLRKAAGIIDTLRH